MSRALKTTKSRDQTDQLFWPRDFNEFWKRLIKWLCAFWIPSRAVNTLLISVINPRWRGNRAKNYKTLQGNQCFSRFKASRCLQSLRINIFWKELIIAEVLSTICINSAEFLVKISLVKCIVNWSLGQFETFVVQNMYFWPALASWVLLWTTAILN